MDKENKDTATLGTPWTFTVRNKAPWTWATSGSVYTITKDEGYRIARHNDGWVVDFWYATSGPGWDRAVWRCYIDNLFATPEEAAAALVASRCWA